jgi:hypothetical protein
MRNLTRMMGRQRGMKQMAVMGAATWAMNRLARRNAFLRRGMRAVNTASWALPLGLMAVDHVRSRRAKSA